MILVVLNAQTKWKQKYIRNDVFETIKTHKKSVFRKTNSSHKDEVNKICLQHSQAKNKKKKKKCRCRCKNWKEKKKSGNKTKRKGIVILNTTNETNLNILMVEKKKKKVTNMQAYACCIAIYICCLTIWKGFINLRRVFATQIAVFAINWLCLLALTLCCHACHIFFFFIYSVLHFSQKLLQRLKFYGK